MNGLQAIRAMAEGKIVVTHFEINSWIYKFKDGNIRMKELGDPSDLWRVAFGFDFDKNYEIFPTEKESGWHDYKNYDGFYVIDYDGTAKEGKVDYFNIGEYEDEDRFTTKEKAQKIAFQQRVFRMLQRFSDTHGNQINWKDGNYKYYIFFDYEKEEFKVESTLDVRDFGQVYFASEEIAKMAITEYGEDLITYFYYELNELEEKQDGRN